MVLKCDCFSHLRPHHCYGRKGDEVELIRDDGTVLIVQAKSGDRFPVTPEKISFKSDDSSTETGADDSLSTVAHGSRPKLRRQAKNGTPQSDSASAQSSIF
jgi:hypothetical protein